MYIYESITVHSLLLKKIYICNYICLLAYFGGVKKIIIKIIMVLKLPHGHEGSEYVLSFEIRQREGGFYTGQTDGRTEPPSSALVYRYIYIQFYDII